MFDEMRRCAHATMAGHAATATAERASTALRHAQLVGGRSTRLPRHCPAPKRARQGQEACYRAPAGGRRLQLLLHHGQRCLSFFPASTQCGGARDDPDGPPPTATTVIPPVVTAHVRAQQTIEGREQAGGAASALASGPDAPARLRPPAPSQSLRRPKRPGGAAAAPLAHLALKPPHSRSKPPG